MILGSYFSAGPKADTCISSLLCGNRAGAGWGGQAVVMYLSVPVWTEEDIKQSVRHCRLSVGNESLKSCLAAPVGMCCVYWLLRALHSS